ncbi:hypothetical protein DL546_006354 [Coniochaeta pulveracea]|uniref:Uncharacterized protein n=1 Tax=Coniochaeta pulveracea TaxID=177199 RepID=A0A420YEA7_9PEZI|nr:hypothetical protein DL546_006354 [Coniochaeta pulveracea]
MGLLFHLKVENQPNPAAIAFQFSTVSFIMLYLYHLLVFCWTITHFGWENMDDMAGSQWDMRVVRALSPPVQKPHEHKDLYFSLFYTTVHVFSLVSALVFWAVLVPTGHGSLNSLDGVVIWGKLVAPFSSGWLQSFCVINLYGVTVLLVLLEILLLNSIKCPVSLVFFSGLYLCWAALGERVTGRSPYFFLDSEAMGGTGHAIAASAGFISLAPTVLSVIYGLTALREGWTSGA